MVFRRGVAVILPVAVLANNAVANNDDTTETTTTTLTKYCLIAGVDPTVITTDDGECGICNNFNPDVEKGDCSTGKFCLGGTDDDAADQTACWGTEDVNDDSDNRETATWTYDNTWTAGTTDDITGPACYGPDGEPKGGFASLGAVSDKVQGNCGICLHKESENLASACTGSHNAVWTAFEFAGTCSHGNLQFSVDSEAECGRCVKPQTADFKTEADCNDVVGSGLQRKWLPGIEIETSEPSAKGACYNPSGTKLTTNYETYLKCGTCIDVVSTAWVPAAGENQRRKEDCEDPSGTYQGTWVPWYWVAESTNTVAANLREGVVAGYIEGATESTKVCRSAEDFDNSWYPKETGGECGICVVFSGTDSTSCTDTWFSGTPSAAIEASHGDWASFTFESACHNREGTAVTVRGVAYADDAEIDFGTTPGTCGYCSDDTILGKDTCEKTPLEFSETGYTFVADDATLIECTIGGDTTIVEPSHCGTCDGDADTETACHALGGGRCSYALLTEQTACEDYKREFVDKAWIEGSVVTVESNTETGDTSIAVQDTEDDSECEASGGRSNLRGGGSLTAAALTALLTTVGATFSSSRVF